MNRNKKGIGRNLLYWGYTMQKTTLQMIAMILLIVAFSVLMDGGNFVEAFLLQLPNYLFMLAFMTVFMNSMNGLSVYFPVTVSLGSSRKQSFIAMQLVQHIQLAEYAVALYLVFFFTQPEALALAAPYKLMILGIFFALLGMGSLVGAAMTKFGRTLGTVFYIGVVIVVVVLGVLCGTAGRNAFLLLNGGTNGLLTGPWILAAGILFDGLMILLLYRLLRKKDLQFA